MPDSKSTTQFRADISQLKSAMAAAQRSVRLASSEFQKSTASLDDWSKSATGLQAKLKQLNTTLAAQKKQADLAREEWEKTKKVYGENSAEADRAKIKLNSYETQVAKTEKEIDKYNKELDDCVNETGKFSKATDNADKSAKDASDGFSTMKGALSNLVASGIKLAISGLKNLAKAAADAYKEFDAGADNVIKATGATGEAAKQLTDSYKNVASSVKGDMEDIGSVVGEVNTRFGFTGDQLEETSQQFLKFADITGVNATDAVRQVSRALESAGIDSKEYTTILDQLAKAGQASGVDISTLAEAITKFGAPMRQLGFDTSDTIALFAQMEKAGVNTETAFAGLKKAVGAWGKEGKNSKEEFQKALDAIQSAPDITAASEAAIEAFGSKAGPELAEAIQTGRFEYKEFLKLLKTSEGTVTDTYEATQDGFDKVALAIQGGRAELGEWVRDLATEHQEELVELVDKIKEKIKGVIKWFVENADTIITTVTTIGKVLATIWAVKKVSAFAGAINGVISSIKAMAAASAAAATATEGASAATGILAKLVSPGGAIVLGIAAVVAVTATLINLFHEEEQEIKILTAEQEENLQKAREMGNAYRELESSRQESMKSVQTEYQHYQDLAAELDTLVDANGMVKAGQEDRAQFILTTLNEALGTEIQMTDGVIQNYQTERQEIEKLMQTKKAQAILNANEEAYTNALEHQTEALTTYVNAQKTLEDLRTRESDLLQQIAESEAEVDRLYQQSPDNAKRYADAHEYLYDDLKKVQYEVGGAVGALHEAETAYQGYNQTIKNYEGLSSSIISGDADKILASLDRVEYGLKDHTTASEKILKAQAEQTKSAYQAIKSAFESGDKTISKDQVDQAKRLADQAEKEYKLAGENAGEGYVTGIDHYVDIAKKSSGNLAKESIDELNKAQESNSPSKKTERSGEYFAEGYIKGMDNKESAVYKKAYELARKAVEALKKGQAEGSPSKITYQSGVYFTQGFINGIASQTKNLVATVKKMATAAIKEGLNVSDGAYDEAANTVTKQFTESLSDKMTYMVNKISYQNEEKLKEFDKSISDLQAKMSAEKDENLKKQYQAQIDEQNKAKTAYQTASQKFISEFQAAMNSYQTQAQTLISTTISGISSKYTAQYNELINKQNSLISKLKSAGNLFEVSGAGILTLSDLKQQTKEITDYTKKLQKIRSNVSEDLFNEITEMDMKEGTAYINQLLAMSEKDLKAYVKAYDEKIKAANKAATIYNKDLDNVAKSYSKEIKDAMAKLPKELEDLGTQAKKGFVNGLTKNTDYMSKEIKTFISGMVNTFKKDLKIASPSKVMEQIGAYTGEGFVDGLKDMIGSAKSAAQSLVSSVSSPIGRAEIGGIGSSSVVNNYNLVQNNTSPKALSALETYKARRQQIAMVKALT